MLTKSKCATIYMQLSMPQRKVIELDSNRLVKKSPTSAKVVIYFIASEVDV